MKLRTVILAAALLFAISAKAQSIADTIVFTPQWTAQAQFAGYYAALEKGFYKEEGLNVVIVHPNSSRTAIDRLRNGKSKREFFLKLVLPRREFYVILNGQGFRAANGRFTP